MKIEITKEDQILLNNGLNSLHASTSRAINTEKNQVIKAIRESELQQIAILKNKLQTQELTK